MKRKASFPFAFHSTFRNFAAMIFYISCTGNTRWAAERLAEATNDQLVFIPDVIDGDCTFESQDKDAWIVFPVHGWRPPKIVREFVSKLTISTPRISALCTAGDSIGRTMEILEKDLSKREIHLEAAYSLIMPESYVGLPFMDVDTKEREEEKLKKAEEDMKGIISGRGDIHRGPLPWLFSGPIGAYFVHRLVKDQPFRVETDRCIRCGKCVEACPVKNLSGGKGSAPEWLHTGRCLTCFACYHHCPTHAIEFGKRTKHKGQYFFKRRQKQPT